MRDALVTGYFPALLLPIVFSLNEFDHHSAQISTSKPPTSEASSSPNQRQTPAPPVPEQHLVASQSSFRQELELFFTTFLTIFVAELGDKTQLTTLLMSAESQSPWIVFWGAGLALILTTLLGVLVGRWLSKHVSIKTLETLTGGILLLISVLLLWDVMHL